MNAGQIIILVLVTGILGMCVWCLCVLWHFRGIPSSTPFREACRIASERAERSRQHPTDTETP